MLFMIFGFSNHASALTFWVKSGLTGTSNLPLSWNTPGTWTTLGAASATASSVIPGAGDTVNILSGKFVSIPQGTSGTHYIATCGVLNITGSGTTTVLGSAGNLFIQGFADLTCSSINMTANGVLTFITIAGNTSSLTCTGTITCGSTTKGALTLIGGATLTCDKLAIGTGTGNGASTISGRNGSTNYGTFIFTGTGTGVVPVLTGDTATLADFSDVTFIPSSSARVYIPSGFSALKLKIKANPDNITINTIDFQNNYSQTFTGGTSLSMEKNTVLYNGGVNQLPYSSYVLDGASTINYSGTDQIIRGLPAPNAYTNLTLSGAGVKTLSTDGDLTIGLTLTIATGVTLKISAGKTLYINGTYANIGTGCIRGSKTSNLTYLGTADSSFNFDQTTLDGNALNNITIGALNQVQPAGGNHLDMIVTSPLNIYGTVSSIVGHLVTNSGTGNVVTLKSNASTTAFIGPIVDGTPEFNDPLLLNNGITGNITVERFIPATRAYRPLSSSVTGGTIFSNWQNGGATASLTGSIYGNILTTSNPSTPLAVGQHISGNLIPANTTITSIAGAASNQYTISTVQNLTSRAMVAYAISTSTVVARFTGFVTANVLSVTGFTSGTGSLAIGQKITGGTLPNTIITGFGTGNGAAGTYTLGLEIPSGIIYYNGAAAGIGTHVTGLACTDAQLGQNDATTGLDLTRSGNSSLYTYASGWNAVTNTKNENLIAGNPYLMLIRGDRTIDLALNASTPTNTTLRSTGEIIAGPLGVLGLNTTTNSFNFVGNPYQAPVNLSTIYQDAARWKDLGTSYTVFDTKANTRGAYVTYDFDLSSSTIAGQTDPTTLVSAMDNTLEPNQAFFVTTTGPDPILVFNETDKDVSSNAYVPMFRSTQNTTPKIRGSICNATTNAALDGFIMAFSDSFNNTIVAEDTRKPTGNQDETFASTNDVTKMAIDKRNFPSEADEIPLSITQYRLTDYKLKFVLNDFDQMDAYLVDTYSATETSLINNQENSYAFTIDAAIPATSAENRFKIVFRNSRLNINSNSISQFTVYPNPVTENKFTIKTNKEFSGKNTDLSIINYLGQEVYKTNEKFLNDGSLMVIPTISISKGVYLLKVTVEGKVETKKLIIK